MADFLGGADGGFSQFSQEQENILIVPPNLAMFFGEELEAHIRIQGKEEGWKKPKQQVLCRLFDLVKEGKKTLNMEGGKGRISKDDKGLFLHENHLRRYFGIVRKQCPGSLQAAVPDPFAARRNSARAAELTKAAADGSGHSSDKLLGAMLTKLPNLTDNVRDDILRSTFDSLDKDKSGKLSRMELLDMMRKVRPIGGSEVSKILEEAADDGDDGLSFSEWINWLNTKANPQLRDGIMDTFKSPAHCIEATFRVWDENGDGTISKKELAAVLRRLNPKMTKSQIEAICNVMDSDHNGKIDYQEFVNFCFRVPS